MFWEGGGRKRIYVWLPVRFNAGGRYCTSFGELQPAAWGGGELPASLSDTVLFRL